MAAENLNFFELLEQTKCNTVHFIVVFNNGNTTLSIMPKSDIKDDSSISKEF